MMEESSLDRKDPALRAFREQLSALDATSHLLTVSGFDLELLLSEIARIAAQKMRVKACSVRLLDELTGEMVLGGVYGLSESYLTKGPVIASKSAVREVVESGKVAQIFDVGRDPRIQYKQEAIVEGIRSMLMVGLVWDGRPIGALSVYTRSPHRFESDEIHTFRAIANQAAVAVSLARLHAEQMRVQQIEQELSIAAEIQTRLLPRQPPRISGLEVAAQSIPHGDVGGDFYDFIPLNGGQLGLTVGDVSGKGIPAAILMATSRSMIRVEAQNIGTAARVIPAINRALCHDTSQEDYVTVFYGVLDPVGRTLTYVNAGHNLPVLLRGSKLQCLDVGGMPLGLFVEADYQEGTVKLQEGDVLVLYTDGYVEVTNGRDEPFGEERLYGVLRRSKERRSQVMIQDLEQAVAEFKSGDSRFRDDRTVVILKF